MKWRVSKQEAGMGLLSFLREHCKEAPSVKALKRAIDAKCCLVNGQIQTFSSYVLHAADQVVLSPSAFEKKEETPLSILYEDSDLLIISKPAGMLSYTKEWHLVHRLDKETSGALILAKTPSAKERMLQLFKERAVQKLYLALVDGVVAKDKGVIDNYLGKKSSYAGQTVYGAVPPSKGLRAITHWTCLSRGQRASLLSCEPHTGRTHQLRVHLSEMGHPILGDRQYATRFKSPFCPARNLLHAYRLIFPHPRTGKPLTVIAPIPRDFKQAMDTLKLSL